MASKIKVDQIQTADGSGTIALQNQLSGMTTASLPTTLLASQMPAGSTIQVVYANASTEIATSSSSWVSTPLAATITPQFASSKILVRYDANMYHYINTQAASTIYRGSTEVTGETYGITRSWKSNSRGFFPHNGAWLDSPNTTSATTYTIYVRKNSGEYDINFPTGAADSKPSITLMEIKV